MISLGDREVKVRKRRENRINKDMTQIITTFFFNSSLKYWTEELKWTFHGAELTLGLPVT